MSSNQSPRLEELDDYVSGTMNEEQAEGLEERLFDSAGPAERGDLHFVDALRRSMTDLAHRGTLNITLTVEEAEALVRTSTLRVNIVEAEKAGDLDLAKELSELDVVLFSFPVPLEGTSHVDLELGWDGSTMVVFPDIRVDRSRNRVVLCCEGELARSALRPGSFGRFVGVGGGERRVLGEFSYPASEPGGGR